METRLRSLKEGEAVKREGKGMEKGNDLCSASPERDANNPTGDTEKSGVGTLSGFQQTQNLSG